MKILLLGAAGFIGTNLALALSKDKNNIITAVDSNINFFAPVLRNIENIKLKETSICNDCDFDNILNGQEVIYHLLSTTIPSTSNQHIPQELVANVVFSAKLFESCVKNGIKKIIFISSGGAVYGKESDCPLSEKTSTNPISSYGIQKITIEKLLYLYRYLYGIDYRIIRLANPYGPYQRPNGVLGAVTTFTYKALKKEEIIVYGNGSVVRDFIYIDDAIRAILKISEGDAEYRTFNLGCGYGTSITELLNIISQALKMDLSVIYKDGRKSDVPVNYLDISRFESCYGKLNPISLKEGIKTTANFLIKTYEIK